MLPDLFSEPVEQKKKKNKPQIIHCLHRKKIKSTIQDVEEKTG